MRVVSKGTTSQRRRYPSELSADWGTRAGGGKKAGEGLELDGVAVLAGYAEGRELSVDDLLEDGGVVEVALGDVGGDVEELASDLGEGEAALGEVVQRDVGDVPRPQEGLEQGCGDALAAAAGA